MYNKNTLSNKNNQPGGIEDSFEEAQSVCEACGGQLKPEKVNLEEFEGGKLYLMENVMSFVCQECGEVWVPEPVLKEFEKMMDVAKEHSAASHPVPTPANNRRKAAKNAKRIKKTTT
jgi:YgiT-type zinc finger domain-containing protein